MILKHGDVAIILPLVEVRAATGYLDTPPTYRVVVEDREAGTITLEPVPKGVLAALAPEKYEAALAELGTYRASNPIRSSAQVLEALGAFPLQPVSGQPLNRTFEEIAASPLASPRYFDRG
jgi:hypothetical protein